MKLDKFAAEVHQNAVEHGWWDKPVGFEEIIVMCHSELSEAVEEYRRGVPMLYYPCNGGGLCVDDRADNMSCGSRVYDPEHPDAPCKARSKEPRGTAVELADCILRILDYFAHEHLSVDSFITEVREEVPFHPTRARDFVKLVCGCHYLLSSAYSLGRFDSSHCKDMSRTRLAACIVDITDWAELSGVDMEMVLDLKHQYNKGRTYRHGGKAL